MQARQGWWHITKSLTIVTPIPTSFRYGVTMVTFHYNPCLACIQPPSFTGFWHSAIPTSSYIFMEMIFYTCMYVHVTVKEKHCGR